MKDYTLSEIREICRNCENCKKCPVFDFCFHAIEDTPRNWKYIFE